MSDQQHPAPTPTPKLPPDALASLVQRVSGAGVKGAPPAPPASQPAAPTPPRAPAPAQPAVPAGGDARESFRSPFMDEQGGLAQVLERMRGSTAGETAPNPGTPAPAPSGDGAGSGEPSAGDDLAERLASGKPRRSDEEYAAGLRARGYDDKLIPVLIKQAKKRDLDSILELPVQSDGTTDRPAAGGGAAANGQPDGAMAGAGATVDDLAGIEAELRDSGLLEEASAKKLVDLLRNRTSGSEAARVAALEAEVAALKAGNGIPASQRVEQYRTKLGSARQKAAGVFPGAADEVLFSERLAPEIERLYRADPSLVDDMDGLVFMAAAKVFGAGGVGTHTSPQRPTPAPSFYAAADSGAKPDPIKLASAAVSDVMLNGRRPDEVVDSIRRRFAR